ncbi:MAG TPA: hypothetical protein VL769_13230 [Acidimicrobiia bacterium]|jgi:hypothetical protein|nr:hypothetical protein [Acidimicrobiia bacterium]
MNRLAFLLAALCLAACGSSGAAARPESTSRPRTSTGKSGATTTTHPVTTTTRLSAAVADQFTQAALSSAVDAARTIYGQSYDYTTVTPASLAALLPKFRFGPIGAASTKIVGVLAQDRNDVLLAARSPSGHWYCIIENATDGVSYGSGTSRDAVDSNGECQKPAWPAPGETPPPF